MRDFTSKIGVQFRGFLAHAHVVRTLAVLSLVVPTTPIVYASMQVGTASPTRPEHHMKERTEGSLDTPHSVPFTLADGRILIAVRIDGHGPFQMIFDSGAGAVLSPDVARDLHLRQTVPHSENGTGANAIQVSQATVRSVSIGAVHLRDVRFDVTSMQDMTPVFGDVRIDGILGRPVFDLTTVQVDYDRRVLRFFGSSGYNAQPVDWGVPFSRVRDVPLIEASLDGNKGEFGVDLGARSSLILTASFASESGLDRRFQNATETVAGWGLGGPIRAKLGRVGDFMFGPFRIADPVVRLSVQKAGLLSHSDTAGLIGADILQQFMITFDSAHRMIYFRPSLQYGRATPFDQSGMWIIQQDNSVQVLDVVPGGAADHAQIHTGDRILTVGGKNVRNLRLPDLRELWATDPPGTKVVLRVEHEGVERTAELILKPIV